MHRRDVAAFTGYEFADSHARGTVAVARNTDDHHGGGTGCQEGTVTFMRVVAGVRRCTREINIEFRAGQNTLMNQTHFTEFYLTAAVRADDDIDIIKDAGADDGNCAAHSFFCGLINEFKSTLQFVFVFHNPAGYCQTHGGMTVVAASMHETGVRGAEAKTVGYVVRIIGFFNRIAVHVEAESRDRTRTTGI